jgi:hypothetical protein
VKVTTFDHEDPDSLKELDSRLLGADNVRPASPIVSVVPPEFVTVTGCDTDVLTGAVAVMSLVLSDTVLPVAFEAGSPIDSASRTAL